MADEKFRFKVGDRVIKSRGDYIFEGVVVSAFHKRDGVTVRYNVEDDRGMLMIMSNRQLEPVEEVKDD